MAPHAAPARALRGVAPAVPPGRALRGAAPAAGLAPRAVALVARAVALVARAVALVARAVALAPHAALLASFAAAPAGCGGGPSCAAIDECESSMSFRLAPLSSLLREAGGAPLALRACVDEVCGEVTLRPDGGCVAYRGALRSCEVWGPEGPERPEPRASGGPDDASTLVLGLRLGGPSRSWQGAHAAALTAWRASGEVAIEARREIELSAIRPPIEGCSGAVCWAGPAFALEVP